MPLSNYFSFVIHYCEALINTRIHNTVPSNFSFFSSDLARSDGRRVARKSNIRWSIWIAFGGLKWNSLLKCVARNTAFVVDFKCKKPNPTIKRIHWKNASNTNTNTYNMKHETRVTRFFWKSLKRKIKPPFTQFERTVCCNWTGPTTAKIIALFHFAFCVHLAQRTTERESFIYSLMMNELSFFSSPLFLSESFDVQISL